MLDQDIVECKQVVMLDIAFALTGAWRFPTGGTAVGTGLNTRVGFAEKVVEKIADFTGQSTLFKFDHFWIMPVLFIYLSLAAFCAQNVQCLFHGCSQTPL